MSEVTIKKEEYESLKKDKERLDFLERCHDLLNEKYKTDWGWEVIINHNVVRLMSEKNIHWVDTNDTAGGHVRIKTCRLAIDKKIDEFRFYGK